MSVNHRETSKNSKATFSSERVGIEGLKLDFYHPLLKKGKGIVREPPSCKFTNALGFTLIELMLTIAIAAVVMGLAVPSFNTAIKNNRLTTQANDLVTSLNLARSEAVKRGTRVTLCKSSDGANCVADGATSNWRQGWIIFTDQNNNNDYDPPAETLLKVQGSAQVQISMAGSGNVVDFISYLASGLVNLGGFITICDDRAGPFGKTIGLGPLGRPSTTVDVACP
ncbi:GspH/FimT family pseudopilin [Methyloglobulus sp.]|uniref:GspH/FimT family pseudopilin n=1 Tax=Methyloglobulus sp. TaxID=2518622 RepID=UPI0032B7B030